MNQYDKTRKCYQCDGLYHPECKSYYTKQTLCIWKQTMNNDIIKYFKNELEGTNLPLTFNIEKLLEEKVTE